MPTTSVAEVEPPQVGVVAVDVSFADFVPVVSCVPVLDPEVALQ